ncbi:sugar O-acyltransferase (sialic acid O-acetyltransferase NeuD family) [Thermonema lapsum]|uniref:Sugar O-acyltransferase (Sialic acid O-acetyltransferase NeuD family) n=1 Tax=Thermonema lapsum TaxID=28195 RepID=A0A846MNC4_9BACT|nr:acetyltransferase [Thermonema lapsum]NIK72969.1 sugar O-acyltransferase (sialic acid O-acetyltransferase NeuD family) [Thermonema lapsum]
MENPVIIFGAGNLGALALDIFNSNDIVVYCFLDEDKSLHNTEINYVAVMGHPDDHGFLKLIGAKCEAFVAEDDLAKRKARIQMLRERRKVVPVNAIHRLAVLSSPLELGYGNLVAAGAILNTFAKMGSYNIVHAGAVIDHHAHLHDHVEVGAGAVVGHHAEIASGVYVGAGATIAPKVKIGEGAQIAPGSVVLRDVKEGAMVFGNPAQEVKA